MWKKVYGTQWLIWIWLVWWQNVTIPCIDVRIYLHSFETGKRSSEEQSIGHEVTSKLRVFGTGLGLTYRPLPAREPAFFYLQNGEYERFSNKHATPEWCSAFQWLSSSFVYFSLWCCNNSRVVFLINNHSRQDTSLVKWENLVKAGVEAEEAVEAHREKVERRVGKNRVLHHRPKRREKWTCWAPTQCRMAITSLIMCRSFWSLEDLDGTQEERKERRKRRAKEKRRNNQ